MSIIEIIIIVLICVLLILLIMQISTNSIMQELESAFLSTDYYIEETIYNSESFDADNKINYVLYKKDPKFYNIYELYNNTAHAMYVYKGEPRKVSTYLKLRRVFAWHNFNKGTLWFKYSVIITDSMGNNITGSLNVPVKLTIEKVKGKWGVTDIDEAP